MYYFLIAVILLAVLFLSSGCKRTHPPIGAMCYDVAVKVESVGEYICPKCGEKTLYSLKSNQPDNQNIIIMVKYELEQCQRQTKQITQPPVELDESQFCKKCSPDITKPQLILVIHFPGEQKEHRYSGVTSTSIHNLTEFLKTSSDCNDLAVNEGKRAYYIEQINTLLGSK